MGLIFLAVGGGLALPTPGHAGRAKLFGGWLEYSLRIHGYLTQTDVSEGSANPGNLLANLPERQLVAELRPDLYYGRDNFDLTFKPRFGAETSKISSSIADDSNESDIDAFVNEWRFRWLGWDDWVLSYGREVLLWGPAYSLNPSNPFYIDAGRTNPYQELGGGDFGTITWFAPGGWTLRYVYNVDQGRQEAAALDEFHQTHAIKIDKTTSETYWSLVYAYRNSAPDHLGFFFQATLSDTVLAYADAGFSLKKTQLSPRQDGAGTSRFEQPSGRGLFGITVLGLAYTFDFGPTVNVEYLYNNQGWNDDRADDFHDLLDSNANLLVGGGPQSGLAAQQLALAFRPGTALRRRNYLFLQYLHTDLIDKLDLTGRVTYNLDDHGAQD